MPVEATVAEFVRFYGGDVFDQGNVTWPWYQFLLRWLPSARASEMLADSKAVAIGAATALDPDGAKSVLNELRNEVIKVR